MNVGHWGWVPPTHLQQFRNIEASQVDAASFCADWVIEVRVGYTSAATRKPTFPALLSGVFELRESTR
jgi:hypothetical protein